MRRPIVHHFNLLQKPLRLCLVMIFLVVMTMGVLSGMSMGAEGDMVGCPLMAHTDVLCTMGVMEHLQTWKSATASTMPDVTSLMVLVVLLALFVYHLPVLSSSGAQPSWITARIWIIFHYLKQALSSGILHPKIFPFFA